MNKPESDLALILSGGGAHAAYQVGFLRCLARHYPDLKIPILTGVSAGGINAAFLANHRGTFPEAVEDLSTLWGGLAVHRIFRVDAWSLFKNVLQWGVSLTFGGVAKAPSRGLVDTAPLRDLLTRALGPTGGILGGIEDNIMRKRLKAFALTATNYTTVQTVTWVRGDDIKTWERPHRMSVKTEITLDQVMASSSLPILFPAIRIGNAWYGDGGISQSAPLSPAIHLRAERVLAISTRYRPSIAEAGTPVIRDYPPLAHVMGILMNAIFLDALDQDLQSLERINQSLENAPDEQHHGLRPVHAFVLRPTVNLGKLAGEFEPHLPRLFRFLVRGLGTRQTENYDWLSMIMFDARYVNRLMRIGEADAEEQLGRIEAFLRG